MSTIELELWRATERCGSEACYRDYLDRYPNGLFANIAREHIEHGILRDSGPFNSKRCMDLSKAALKDPDVSQKALACLVEFLEFEPNNAMAMQEKSKIRKNLTKLAEQEIVKGNIEEASRHIAVLMRFSESRDSVAIEQLLTKLRQTPGPALQPKSTEQSGVKADQSSTVERQANWEKITEKNVTTYRPRRFFDITNVESWDTLNIRNDANPYSHKVGEIPHDGKCLEYHVTRYYKEDPWFEITYGGIRGWINSEYVKMSFECHPKPAQLTARSIPSGYYIVASDDNSGTVKITSEAGNGHEQTSTIPDGSCVLSSGQLMKSAGQSWLKIHLGVSEGWVPLGDLKRVETCDPLPSPARHPTAYFRVINVEDSDVLNLREQPSPRSPIVYRIPYDGDCLEDLAEAKTYKSSVWR